MRSPIRALRRYALQFKINSLAHEAKLCLRDEQVARDNYRAAMDALGDGYARLARLDGSPPMRPAPARVMPLLLVPRR